MRQLIPHDWHNHVRKSQNLIKRHIAISDSNVLHLDGLGRLCPAVVIGCEIDLDPHSLEELESCYVLKVLEHFQGNREQTAATLGIN